MKRLLAGGAVAAALALIAVGQSAAQTPPQPQNPPTAQAAPQKEVKAPEQQVTLVGCVQPEADYRSARNLGRGGAAGTGAGVGNEFVLINASISTAAASGTPSAEAATGTAGGAAMAKGDAYELTGANESQAAQFVGKRVEIIGKLKPAEVGATGPTGGATAGAPPKGVDATSSDLKLRELEVTSVRETTGTCPAMPK